MTFDPTPPWSQGRAGEWRDGGITVNFHAANRGGFALAAHGCEPGVLRPGRRYRRAARIPIADPSGGSRRPAPVIHAPGIDGDTRGGIGNL